MSLRTGCRGKILIDDVEVAEVRNWSFSWVATLKEYASSSTSCAKKRIGTQKDVQGGRFEVYIDDADRIDAMIEPGDVVTLKLYEDATKFWTITDTTIGSLDPATDIENDEIVGASVAFEGGTVTKPTSA